MSKLYHEWASLYDALYVKLFDYDAELALYGRFLDQYGCRSVLEYGCGTGHLAQRLARAGYAYEGIDLSEDMIQRARTRNPTLRFTVSDLQTFARPERSDAALITGRTMSYLTTNEQVMRAFRAIHQNLKPGGLLIFDAIEAGELFRTFASIARETIDVSTEQGRFRRISENSPALVTGWTWDWKTTYFREQSPDKYELIGNDQTTLRAFLNEELTLLLNLCGFALVDCVAKPAYTWQSPYYVALSR